MAKDNKIQLPSSMGGLVSYSSDYKSKIEIMPGTVIITIVVIMVLMILLNIYGLSFLGL